MEKTFNVNQRNKILKMNHKKTPTNSLDFIPISIKQNSDSHYFTSITESKNKNLKDKKLDNLLHSNTKLKLSKIRNIGRNIIRSVTPNQSKKNLIDNNINSNQSYLKLSLLPDIYKNNITDSSYKENNDLNKQLQIIFSLKKKIIEMNKIVLSKNKEIEDLKRDINIFTVNQLNSEIIILKNENEKLKSYIKNNKDLQNTVLNDKNINYINDLKNQIDILKKENEVLYKDELDKNNILNRQINDLNKNFKLNNNNNKDYDKQKLLNQISNQEKIIIQLKEKNKLINKKTKFEDNELEQSNNIIFEIISYNKNINHKIKKKNYKIELIKSSNENFSIISKSNNNSNNNYNKNKKIFNLKEQKFFLTLKSYNKNNNNMINNLKLLTEEEYGDIELLLNILYTILNINKNEIVKIFNLVNNELIVIRNICNLFKIIDDPIIERFIFKISQNKNGSSINIMKEKFLNIFNKTQIGINIESMNNFINEIIEKCQNYDYKKEGFIPYYLFKNIYSQICFREKINLIPEEFNLFLSIMKKNKTNENGSIYNLNYLNLKEYYNSISNQILIGKKNIIKKDKYDNKKFNKNQFKNNQNEGKIVKNPSLKPDSNNINRIKSFDNEMILLNEKNENSKIINDFLDKVMKNAYERYKEKIKSKKNYSQKDLFFVKYN